MSSIFDTLTEQLGGKALEQISRQIGANPSATKDAMPAALGSLMAALAGNAASSGGAESLNKALERDHDGSVLDNLGGFLSNPQGGADILKHVLGGKQPLVEAGISQKSGLDASSASQLLKVLAPVVLGALGKARKSGNLDAGSLAGMLAGERQAVAQKAPQGLDLLSGLDADGDGQILDDIASKVGGSLLKNLFK
jgi:hypothetical protein